jgi:hypothetical protein
MKRILLAVTLGALATTLVLGQEPSPKPMDAATETQAPSIEELHLSADIELHYDCSSVTGELSTQERYQLGKAIAEYASRKSEHLKVALIGKLSTVTGFAGTGSLESRATRPDVF